MRLFSSVVPHLRVVHGLSLEPVLSSSYAARHRAAHHLASPLKVGAKGSRLGRGVSQRGRITDTACLSHAHFNPTADREIPVLRFALLASSDQAAQHGGVQ